MEKPWYASKTIWGSILMLVALIGSQFGVNLSTEEQGTASDQIVAVADAVIALVGFILTIIGRVKAKVNLR